MSRRWAEFGACTMCADDMRYYRLSAENSAMMFVDIFKKASEIYLPLSEEFIAFMLS